MLTDRVEASWSKRERLGSKGRKCVPVFRRIPKDPLDRSHSIVELDHEIFPTRDNYAVIARIIDRRIDVKPVHSRAHECRRVIALTRHVTADDGTEVPTIQDRHFGTQQGAEDPMILECCRIQRVDLDDAGFYILDRAARRIHFRQQSLLSLGNIMRKSHIAACGQGHLAQVSIKAQTVYHRLGGNSYDEGIANQGAGDRIRNSGRRPANLPIGVDDDGRADAGFDIDEAEAEGAARRALYPDVRPTVYVGGVNVTVRSDVDFEPR